MASDPCLADNLQTSDVDMYPTQVRQQEGFTLLELMIVVAIVAILAAVAIVAYIKHVNNSRMVGERAFLSSIQGLQESYFQRFGCYHDATGLGTGNPYPTFVPGEEPTPKTWDPTADGEAGWRNLGAQPEARITYFRWVSESSGCGTAQSHARNSEAQKAIYNIPPQPGSGSHHPWYYIRGEGDLENDNTAPFTTILTSSGRAEIVTINEGK